MMQSLNSDVWIKGWFDGDYNDNDNPAIEQQSQLDTKATRVNIIRGRMTSIERIERRWCSCGALSWLGLGPGQRSSNESKSKT